MMRLTDARSLVNNFRIYFSSDNDTQPNNVIQNSDPNSMDNDAVSFNPPIEREVIKPDIEPTNTSKFGKSGKLDFDNLVVRKV